MEIELRTLTDEEVSEFKIWMQQGEHGPILGLTERQILGVKESIKRSETEQPPFPGSVLRIAVWPEDAPIPESFSYAVQDASMAN